MERKETPLALRPSKRSLDVSSTQSRQQAQRQDDNTVNSRFHETLHARCKRIF